jgi:hypothetical protein
VLAVSLLDGQIRDAIWAGFKGRLLKGVLRRYIAVNSGGLDDLGDPIDTSDYTEWPIEGFRDEFSRFTRAQAGIPDTDYKICIFGGVQPDLTPKHGDLVRLDRASGSFWSRLNGEKSGIKIDPAGALWDCRASEAEAP